MNKNKPEMPFDTGQSIMMEDMLSHLSHLACNIAFLFKLEKKGTNKGNETRNDSGNN